MLVCGSHSSVFVRGKCWHVVVIDLFVREKSWYVRVIAHKQRAMTTTYKLFYLSNKEL
jgi:hypothetical protein